MCAASGIAHHHNQTHRQQKHQQRLGIIARRNRQQSKRQTHPAWRYRRHANKKTTAFYRQKSSCPRVVAELRVVRSNQADSKRITASQNKPKRHHLAVEIVSPASHSPSNKNCTGMALQQAA
jgi:hypothetical protein